MADQFPSVAGRAGKLVLVVGASGAGKDTLVQFARRQLAAERRLHFVEREITRPLAAHEYHVCVSDEEYDERLRDGCYLLHWRAHGVRYGIPRRAADALRSGDVVVSIASRALIDVARALPWSSLFVEVRAPLDVIGHRLQARGERLGSAISARVARAQLFELSGTDIHVLDNGGHLADSGNAFVALLLRLLAGMSL